MRPFLAGKIKVVNRKVDYIVVGQGIAGTWLSYELITRGHKILIFNHESPNTASLKAAGIYNPITGRKMVKTWLADQLFADLEERYKTVERLLGKNFIHSIPIYRPFLSIEERNDWEGRMENGFEAFIAQISSLSHRPKQLNDPSGGIFLRKSGYVDLETLILSYRSYLIDKGIYRSEMFDYKSMKIGINEVLYNGIEASKIIFCEGPSLTNPYWNNLPYKLVRGELMDIECNLSTENIVNRGVFMIPKSGYFTVGSTYDHSNLSYEPQESGISDLEGRLSKLFKGSYRIIDKRAGIRPATKDRKPFIGLHPEKETLGIFNGFGTKGVSLTPYFATQFVDFLEGNGKIEKEADVQRVY